MENTCNAKRGSFCNNEECQICFNASFVSHPKSKFLSDKNKINPRQISKKSEVKLIFDYNTCHHEFITCVNNIYRGSWCHFCSNIKLCSDENCQLCEEKSFQSNPKAKYWCDENKIKPREVFKKSGKKFIFKCEICEHKFINSLNKICANTWCPFCSNRKLCNDENCKLCFEKSFLSHSKAKHWSKNNSKKPREIFRSTNYKFKFLCDICNHEFEKSLHSVIAGSWCPFCANQKICNDLKCEYCYLKSFQSHPKAKYWSNKNQVNPRQVMKGSEKKFYFNCEVCQMEYFSILFCVTSGKGCPHCKNKTEKKLLKWLKDEFLDSTIETQKTFDWCRDDKTKRCLKYDFLITNLKILIELDGPQHMQQVSNWPDYKITKTKDIFKIESAIENKYAIIHLLQDDVYRDKNDWKLKLKTLINKKYNESICIFLDNNNKYKEHIIDCKNKNIKMEII